MSNDYRYIPIKGQGLNTYMFQVVLMPDGQAWIAYCPLLQRYGVWTRGATPHAVLRQIQELAQQVVSVLTDSGMPVPQDVLISITS
jgi:predicted RNase H-like HicB family nuclease